MKYLMKRYVDGLQAIQNIDQYDECISSLKEDLVRQKCNPDIRQAIINRAKYTVNSFSAEASQESMKRSRDNLIDYLQGLLIEEDRKESEPIVCLHNYLKHFYSFLEAFREIKPHKKATLTAEDLQKITIQNEYDLQHLLYAGLKPLWQDTRTEVVEDTGYGSVRVDIVIDSIGAAIEAKCTRESMTVKDLTEQIAADIFHYKQKYLFIYIYDKEKIIKDKDAFESAYSRRTEEKQVFTIVLQPVHL